MSETERVVAGWSLPRRTPHPKGHLDYASGRSNDGHDRFGDFIGLLPNCNKSKKRKDSWIIHSGNSDSNRGYISEDCILKSETRPCNCLCKHGFCKGKSKCTSSSSKHSKERMPSWLHTCSKKELCCHQNSVGYARNKKNFEEFVLDSSKLCFNYNEIPKNVPKRQQFRKAGKVKTVSIIDTLSELASGATDREDEGCFSSAVSESAVLGPHNLYPHRKYEQHWLDHKKHLVKQDYLTTKPCSGCFPSNILCHLQVDNNYIPRYEALCSSQVNCPSDDGSFSCNSLKHTLKYMGKAVSSNVMEQKPSGRKHFRQHDEKDEFRQCFSDSEVQEIPNPWNLVRHEKPELWSRTKCKSLLTVASQSSADKLCSKLHGNRIIAQKNLKPKTDPPDWIKKVFCAAKNGELDKLKHCLKDIDTALIRNLSDDHGNNLWHICAAHNHVQCLKWLCSKGHKQAEALNDENRRGFTPVALAVKFGSLLAVQWLIHNTMSKSQLLPSGGNRSLLHIAAKYGQETSMQWLLSYMNDQDIHVNGQDSEGNTALHLAAKHGHINCIKALIFQNADVKAKNDHGLKPLNLAVQYSQTNCVDYLLAMESCFNLASASLRQQQELQQLQKENSEIRTYFKELLMLTKRLQHRQREVVQSFTCEDSCVESNFGSGTARSGDKQHSKHVSNYSQILSAVLADEERHIKLVEDKCKRSGNHPKSSVSKKTSLDIIRLQFTDILNKVNVQSQAIPSTTDSSDEYMHSEEEDITLSRTSVLGKNVFPSPDVIHAASNKLGNFVCPEQNLSFSKASSCSVKPWNALEAEQWLIPFGRSNIYSKKKIGTTKLAQGSSRNVNLQMFFKENPNLRQTSETCSVLEVLEPSSSDSDENIGSRKNFMKFILEDEASQSSSNVATGTVSPLHHGLLSLGSKRFTKRENDDACRSFSNTEKSNRFLLGSVCQEAENQCKEKVHDSASNDCMYKSFSIDENSVEPDLIRSIQRRNNRVPNVYVERNDNPKENKLNEGNVTDNPSLSTEDSESLEADHSFSSALDVPISTLQSQTMSATSMASTGAKKKNFLLKFSLRSRWPTKARTCSSKNEISAQEFHETYTRSSENISPPSQILSSVGLSKKLTTSSTKDSQKPFEESLYISGNCCLDKNRLNAVLPPIKDASHCSQPKSKSLFPARREPPPVPPCSHNDKEPPQPPSSDKVQSCNDSSVASDISGSPVLLHNAFIMDDDSNLWQSAHSKSLFRPASSASQVESAARAEDNFLLNKSSSASTEILSALDSSTTGRQSPAPSEVSKTESALSPPSDISKTESARYLSQLGRIEEGNHLASLKTSMSQTENEVESREAMETKSKAELKKKSSFKIHGSDKPWYEFSDDEDVILPQRYEVMSERIRCNSEDETIVS